MTGFSMSPQVLHGALDMGSGKITAEAFGKLYTKWMSIIMLCLVMKF